MSNNTTPALSKMRLMRRAVQLWTVRGAPRAANRYNQRAWLRAVEQLGDRWLLAQRVERKNETQA